jgi:hypothetical protein
MITGMIKAAFPYQQKSEFLESLRRNSKDLMAITDDFRPLSEQYSITSFWEEDRVPGLGIVRAPILLRTLRLIT